MCVLDSEKVKVYETTDYDKFKKLEGNRDAKSAKKVIQSIQSVGYIMSPILVNEKFEVIDGQNRLEALKELGLPVHYIMQSGIGLEECRSMNTGRSNWTTLDYVYSYAEGGSEDYKRLASLINEYGKKFTIEGVCAFTIGVFATGSGSMNDLIKQGRVVLPEKLYEIARARLKSAEELGFVGMYKNYKMYARSWFAAIAYAYNHNDVSVRELANRCKASPLELVSYNKTVDQLALLDRIYNKHRSSGKVFMSTDFQRGLYLKPIY